jgi:hypothetical protein
MNSDSPAQSNAASDPASLPPLMIEFDTEAPVLNPDAARALLRLLLSSDRIGPIGGDASASPDRAT